MSVLSRLRGRRAHAQLTAAKLDGTHPPVCRCQGRGVMEDRSDCPLIWVAHQAPPSRWLVGRIPRGMQR